MDQVHPRRPPNPKIDTNERVRRNLHVTAEARPHPRSDTIPHLLVEDLIAFSEALVKAEAPIHESVRAILVRNHESSGSIRSLHVEWSEDLINGKPAPQVKEQYHGE